MSSVSRYDEISRLLLLNSLSLMHACIYVCVQHLTLNFTTSAKQTRKKKKIDRSVRIPPSQNTSTIPTTTA